MVGDNDAIGDQHTMKVMSVPLEAKMALWKKTCLHIYKHTLSMLVRQRGQTAPAAKAWVVPSKGIHPNKRCAREVHHPQPYTAAGADSARCSSVGLKAYA